MLGIPRRNRTLSLFIVVLSSVCFWPLAASAVDLGQASDGRSEVKTIQLIEGSQKVIRRGQRVVRVAVGNPAVADVNVLNTRDLLITGHKAGSTTFMVWAKGAAVPEEFRIVVGSPFDPAIKVPNRLGAIQTQVMTDIKIAEVSRTALRQFGINLFPADPNHGPLRPNAITRPGTLASATPVAPLTLTSTTGFLPISDAFNLLFFDSEGDDGAILSVLERNGLARVLAEPSLVAMSGQSASFLAGGEFPIPVQQGSSGAGGGGITVEFKQFGVRLTLTPTVLGNERIALKVAPEVSELDFTAGINAGGVSVPALTVRRTETTVELGNGESFVISGLVSQSMKANVDKVPYLGNLPILGSFFRSTRFEREDKELVMVVSPTLVKPFKRGAQLPALPGSELDEYNPSSGELILYEDGSFDENNYGFSRFLNK